MQQALIRTSGKNTVKIPAVLGANLSSSSSVASFTPEWMVSIDTLTKSSVENYTTYIELPGWWMGMSHPIAGNVSGELFISGAIKGSDLVLIIPNGEHGPKIERLLYSGKLISKLIIVRLGWTEEVNQKLQEITFEKVRMIGYQQNIRYLVLFAQTQSKKNDITIFKQIDGTAQGHKISSVDFSTAKLTFTG